MTKLYADSALMPTKKLRRKDGWKRGTHTAIYLLRLMATLKISAVQSSKIRRPSLDEPRNRLQAVIQFELGRISRLMDSGSQFVRRSGL
jgi:hypothetical protein